MSVFPRSSQSKREKCRKKILGRHARIHLLAPLDYSNFLAIMRSAWLIVSDSGGVQEEAPSLGKPLLILRENTERPEAISSGVARLVGGQSGALSRHLEENYADDSWVRSVTEVSNPFGDGTAAANIVRVIEKQLFAKQIHKLAAKRSFSQVR